jgi:hypothetical protein
VADTPKLAMPPPEEKNPHCVLDAPNGPMLRAEFTPQIRVVPVALALQTINSVNAVVMGAPERPIKTSPPSKDAAGKAFCPESKNVGAIESAPGCVRFGPEPDLSLTNFTGPLFVTVPTPLLVGPSVVVSARSYHAWSPAMLLGLNPVARGLSSLGDIAM